MPPRPRLTGPSRVLASSPPFTPSRSSGRPRLPFLTLSHKFSSSSLDSSSITPPATSEAPPAPPARWLSDLQARVGKCIIFGCPEAQIGRAATVLRALATEWRELTAGSEGFLTGGRRGLEGQKVVWGEMDSFVCLGSLTRFACPLSYSCSQGARGWASRAGNSEGNTEARERVSCSSS